MSSESKSQPSKPQGAETLNQYGSDRWVVDQTKLRARASGGLFTGLRGQKRYSVDQGWAKRQNERDTWFLTGLWEKFWGSNSR
ncbi:hypothetical protein VTO42DRAFT_8257 [Malbranchea cinnamomea]